MTSTLSRPLDDRGTAVAVPDVETDPRDPRVRLADLFDDETMHELAAEDLSGVVIARGRIGGILTIGYATDVRIMGGAMGIEGCLHIEAAIRRAAAERVPVVGIWHSGGARLAEGVLALDAVGKVFAAMIDASGRVPQISIVLGPAAGGAAYGPALTDIVVMSRSGRVFVTGPDVVRSVTGEDIDMDSLGGPDTHGRRSGVAHITEDDDAAAIARGRELVALLGRPGSVHPERIGAPDDLAALLPEASRRAYDIHPVITALLDREPGFVELQRAWAPNVVTGFGRLTGQTVGIVANNPLRLGGCLDSRSAEKASRFVRLCDAFGIPLVVLVDVPGYLPGVSQEWGGVVRRGAKLLHAFKEAVVPRVTLILRKSYGGAYIAMNARSLGANAVYAWPGAEIAVMGAEAAVKVLHRKKIAAADPADVPALIASLVEEHERMAGGVGRARDIGVVDGIIDPARTRQIIATTIGGLPPNRGAHGNIPL